ncbi:MAG: hypothetical protein J7M29_12930, partial [Verrucomicrobia bacterium]|nr:hypothetical protein [Verrucomicrobiota bacterium]
MKGPAFPVLAAPLGGGLFGLEAIDRTADSGQVGSSLVRVDEPIDARASEGTRPSVTGNLLSVTPRFIKR